MDTGEFGTEQVKKEVEMDHNNFNEAFPTDTVKHEPCKINIFSKCGMYDESSSETDFVDHKHSSSFKEQTEEKRDANKFDPDYIDHPEVCGDILSTDKCNMEQMKNENNIDIFPEDIKSEIKEEVSSELYKFCEVCIKSFSSEAEFSDSKNNRLECSCQVQNDSIHLQDEVMTQDVIVSSLGFNTESGIQQLIVQDKTRSGDECSNEPVLSAVSQRENNEPSVNNIPDEIRPKRQKTVRPKKRVQCQTCSKFLCNARELKIHERMHTGEKPFHCQTCLKSFVTSSRLAVHVKIHTGERPFQCHLCTKSFISYSSLKNHVRVHTGEKPFQCKFCSLSFMFPNKLKIHERIHTGERPFHCKICSKSFIGQSYLNVHLRIHAGKKPYQCKVCSRSFTHSNTLKAHNMKNHSGERPFSCKICCKSFGRETDLDVHLKNHMGGRSFHCEVCSKSFLRSGTLNAHMKIHTGEKPFLCKVCTKPFITSTQLKAHERIHTRFHCEICTASFTGESYFNTHLKMHTEEKSFHCKFCSKSFYWKSHLKVHENEHKEEKSSQ